MVTANISGDFLMVLAGHSVKYVLSIISFNTQHFEVGSVYAGSLGP